MSVTVGARDKVCKGGQWCNAGMDEDSKATVLLGSGDDMTSVLAGKMSCR